MPTNFAYSDDTIAGKAHSATRFTFMIMEVVVTFVTFVTIISTTCKAGHRLDQIVVTAMQEEVDLLGFMRSFVDNL